MSNDKKGKPKVTIIKRGIQFFWIIVSVALAPAIANANSGKPNILVLWGDDIVIMNVSAYGKGIMGQTVLRTNLSKVGLPGGRAGLQIEDPTIAGLLNAAGYAAAQFGTSRMGDRDTHLPTNHGFDKFFGNLHHLNAEEAPKNEDYPRDLT